MSLSANATAAPAAAPAAPPVSDFMATQALIKEISAEASSHGKGLFFDPETGVDAAGDEPAGEASSAGNEAQNGTKQEGGDEDVGQVEDGDQGQEHAEEGSEAEAAAEIDVERVKSAVNAEGVVDLAALAEALGIKPEALGMSPAQFKAARLERSKAQKTLQRAHDLSQKLERQFGDQVRARKAVEIGDLMPAVEFIQNTFGMEWNELNRAVIGLLQGKPVQDIESKRELREFKRREAERAENEKKTSEAAAKQQKVDQAKLWITNTIKADPLMSDAVARQLKAAGMPPIVDLVFEEMQSGYAKGLTDPKKALDRVRQKLTTQAKALQAAKILPASKPAPATKKPVSTSPPRANAQTGSAGNGRPMNDAEMRQAVLREAGLIRGK